MEHDIINSQNSNKGILQVLNYIMLMLGLVREVKLSTGKEEKMINS